MIYFLSECCHSPVVTFNLAPQHFLLIAFPPYMLGQDKYKAVQEKPEDETQRRFQTGNDVLVLLKYIENYFVCFAYIC